MEDTVATLTIEQRLLRRVAAGEQSAFNELFDRYHPAVHSTALKLTGDALAAEEIVQDTFLKVWLKKDELTGLGNFKGWLYTIARNFTYNALREAKTERERMLTSIKVSWAGSAMDNSRSIRFGLIRSTTG